LEPQDAGPVPVDAPTAGPFRNTEIYNAMFRDAEQICQVNNVERIQTTDTAIQMDEGERLSLLHNYNYHHIDGVWEVKRDV
jgi:hypothetical protein